MCEQAGARPGRARPARARACQGKNTSRPRSGKLRKRRTLHEDPRPRQAGGRLQRQGPGEVGRHRRRDRRGQDVDEPVRRNRRRGGGAPEGKGRRHRDRRGVAGAARLRRDHPHRAGHGRRPRHPGGDRCRAGAAGGGQAAEGAGRSRAAAAGDPGQAGDRRRHERHRPDAGRPAGLAAGHLRQQGDGARAARSP